MGYTALNLTSEEGKALVLTLSEKGRHRRTLSPPRRSV